MRRGYGCSAMRGSISDSPFHPVALPQAYVLTVECACEASRDKKSDLIPFVSIILTSCI